MTLAELRALVRLTLADAAAWPDAKLDGWIVQSIQLYSAHFPRRWRHTQDLITGQQAYDLPGEHDLVKVLSVEYPLGRIPPEFLTLAPAWSPAFGAGDRVYALQGMPDSAGDGGVGQILFAPTVSTGEQALIEYLGAHDEPAIGANATVITVPRAHLQAITAFVEFAAHYELESDEAVTVESSSVVLAQLGEESRKAWNRYKDVLDRLTWLSDGGPLGSSVVSWGDLGL